MKGPCLSVHATLCSIPPASRCLFWFPFSLPPVAIYPKCHFYLSSCSDYRFELLGKVLVISIQIIT